MNQIPETNIITNASQGEVYCFIPTDPEAVIEIFKGAKEPTGVVGSFGMNNRGGRCALRML